VSGTEAPKFPFPYTDWDPSVSLANDGFSEFIEVAFELPVAVMQVEVGEPRGAGSIVKIEAISEDRTVTATLWEGSADPATDAWHDKTKVSGEKGEERGSICLTHVYGQFVRSHVFRLCSHMCVAHVYAPFVRTCVWHTRACVAHVYAPLFSHVCGTHVCTAPLFARVALLTHVFG